MRVFDFDNTIYDGESVIDFYLFSLRRNPKVARYVPVVLYHLLRYKLGRTTMADLEQAGRKHAAQYLSSFDDPEGLVRDFWDGHIRKIKAWYHPEKDDVIVTASLNLIMDEVCRRLGVQHCICSVVDRQTLTVEYINFNANKVSAFRKCFGAGAVPDAFYTDNAADLPMIHLSRTAYKVRRNRITRIK